MTLFEPTRIHVSLPRHTIFPVPDAAGVAIECRSGSVWITLDNDPRDVVLTTGQRFDGDVHQRALVSALESACIAVSSSEPVALPRLAATGAAPRAAWSWRGVAHGMTPA